MRKLQLVKIGGAVIEDENRLDDFLSDFAQIQGPKILVHGGGKKASEWAKKMNIAVQMVEGRRITDRATLEVVSAVYAGLINKRIVAKLQARGCNAIGLSGADGNAIEASQRKNNKIDYGFVGDVTQINASAFQQWIDQDMVPVCCAITHNGNGQLLNTNADTIAAEISKALAPLFDTSLYFCFELNGVLRAIENPNSLIEELDPALFTQLCSEGVIAKGMLPKLHNAFDALKQGVGEVRIGPTKMITENSVYTRIVNS